MGYCVCIEDRKYPRNALLFNICFVFRSSISTVDLQPYRPIVRMVGQALRTVECESEFLFRKDTKVRMKEIIANIRQSLNDRGSVTLDVDDVNTVNLFLSPPIPPSQEFSDGHVIPTSSVRPFISRGSSLVSLECARYVSKSLQTSIY